MSKLCPLLGKECIEHQCKFYVHLLGVHPQTGNPIDNFDCSIAWLPVLLIESAKETRQTAAAVESFRNEMVSSNDRMLQLAAMNGPMLLRDLKS